MDSPDVSQTWREAIDRDVEEAMERWRAARSDGGAHPQRQCGAKTRKGHPCPNRPEEGKHRCKFHGGKSTGPRTTEGRERIAEAQRRRWAKHQNASTTRARGLGS